MKSYAQSFDMNIFFAINLYISILMLCHNFAVIKILNTVLFYNTILYINLQEK